ncbi:EAL domain-containing protein [Chromohalobacter sarecensis]|uniref:EAL domain-containing protein n=1 Tax=Chromohalobacter sarecensis TaxID=245294 RepID=A0ABV9CY23_9GAMM|nr:EAL domain-containing protein [Chromohalobacter sarecensis]MCK0715637.1 EAL domain-containing protein [Chromohalobacter sarecensis]
MLNELALMETQQKVHERITQQVPLEETLDAIACWIEVLLPEAIVAFMRFDPERQTLSLYPTSRFSSAYQEQLQEVPVGPEATSCGYAAFYRQPVVTEDIRSDPRWSALHDAAEREGLRACCSNPVMTAKGELLGTFGTYFRQPFRPTDMSQRRLRQAAALIALAIIRDRDASSHRTLAEWHRSLFVNHPDGVYEFDLEGCFQRGNAALTRITGYPEEALVGRHFNEFIEPDYRSLTQASFDIARQGGSRHYETMGTHRDGHPYRLEILNFPVSVDGKIVGVYGICRDITQQREQEVQLAYQATHDLLTRLPNRSVLDGRLEKAFEQEGRLLVVMHLDLDGFKTINDGLGHHIGNQLLVALADRLRQVIGEDDTLVRLTGDEFALLFTHFDDCQAGVDIAERVLEALSTLFQIEGKSVHISASIGIACNCECVEHAHELMQRADLAMADAKQQGRNTWYWYQGDELRVAQASVLLRHDLHTALRDDQFELYYQPIVETANGRIRGLEALIRWHHPEQGMVSPGVFIPLAEQTGQIIPLGRWILRRVCQEAATMQAAGERVVPVAVNISSLQFRRAGFLEDVQQALSESGLPPALLELEVTESVLLDGAEQAIALINRLKAMGIKVALDDFGTGFSSLSYLRDLPIHKVKLDRAFIKDITTDRRDAAIVQGIIDMAHHLDLVVVAEGIEEREQQQDLIHRNCDLLQGFLFAKPMPQEAVMELPDLLPANPEH